MFLLRKILEINIWRNNPDFPITAFMHPVFHIDVGWLYAAPGARNWSSLASVDGLWPSIFLLITFQRFPIGFRSGDRAGYDRVLIWWSSIHTLINLLCSMEHCPAEKKSSDFGNIVRAEGSKFSSSTTLYVAWIMCPSQRQMCLIPAFLKHPHIITNSPPNFTVGTRHCGL